MTVAARFISFRIHLISSAANKVALYVQRGAEAPREVLPIVSRFVSRNFKNWLRGGDLNPRPLGYEPNELPDCSTPRHDSQHLQDALPPRLGRTARSEHPNVARRLRLCPRALGRAQLNRL